jgi:hypothetical protein
MKFHSALCNMLWNDSMVQNYVLFLYFHSFYTFNNLLLYLDFYCDFEFFG